MECEDFLFIHNKKKSLTDGDRKQHNIQQTKEGLWRMVKPMCNYFSWGWMERAGLGFDKNRTKSKFGNNFVYVWEAGKKLIKTAPKNNDVTDTFSFDSLQEPNPIINQKVKGIKGDIFAEELSDPTTISFDRKRVDMPHWRGKCADLIFMNIPSIAGGVDPWSWSIFFF